MIRLVRVAVLAVIAFLGLSLGVVVGTGTAAANTVGDVTQPKTGAVVVTSETNKINVQVINRTTADECTVTASREVGDETVIRTVKIGKLNKENQFTGVATFSNLPKANYTVSGTCKNASSVGNLFGGTNKVSVGVDGAPAPANQYCITLVRAVATSIGLTGNELAIVMTFANQYCPR